MDIPSKGRTLKPLSPLSNLRKRVLELSFKHNLGHIGSCLTMLPILHHIYSIKDENDEVVLSAGHAGLALYVILEDLYGHNAEKMLEDFGIHPCRDIERNIPVSAGSLGLGITIAVGMAVANPDRGVYCVSTDGEIAEGSWWEALRFAHKKNLSNFVVFINANGYSAYDEIDVDKLAKELSPYTHTFLFRTNSDMEFAKGLAAHYMPMKPEDYEKMVNENA